MLGSQGSLLERPRRPVQIESSSQLSRWAHVRVDFKLVGACVAVHVLRILLRRTRGKTEEPSKQIDEDLPNRLSIAEDEGALTVAVPESEG